MLFRTAKAISVFALTVGAAGVVAPPASAAVTPGIRVPVGAMMLKNVATGNCLTATSAGYGFAGLQATACNRNNALQWWANNTEKLEEISNYGACLVHRELPGNRMGQVGTEACASADSPNWFWGSNPSTISSVTGGYLDSTGGTASMGPLTGNNSKWTRVS